MTIRVAINGYGRIGRNILRAHYESAKKHPIEIVARRILLVNDPARAERALALLQLIRPSAAPPPDAEDLFNLTKGILDLNRLIAEAQGKVREGAGRLDTEAQALADS